MGDPVLDRKNYTLQEYFEIDNASDIKYEYEEGEFLARPIESVNHSRIGRNISAYLFNKLKGGPCETFNSDIRVYIAAVDSSVHPDAMVTCREIEFSDEDQEAILNPTLVIEVLSKNTTDYDHGKKFQKYRSLDSLKEYMLVNQYEKRIELFSKTPQADWLFQVYHPERGSVPLASIKVELSFEEIYEGVEL